MISSTRYAALWQSKSGKRVSETKLFLHLYDDMNMITSSSNKNLKLINALNTSGKERRKTGLFVAEGERLVFDAPDGMIESVFVTQDFYDLHRSGLEAFPDVQLVADQLLRSVSDTKTPQGIIAIARQPVFEFDMTKSGIDFYMLLEDVQDPGNMGTIMRTAEGAGVGFVFTNRGCVDLYNPKTVRSTMGSIFRVPHVLCEDLCAVVDSLKKAGVSVYAAHLKGERSCFEPDYTKPTAFIIGNEGNGLSDAMAEAATELVKIPMAGSLESLNASVAASVLMYETARQRLAV